MKNGLYTQCFICLLGNLTEPNEWTGKTNVNWNGDVRLSSVEKQDNES